MSFPPRYLTSFGPKDTPHLFTDVLVIGAGIAGLRAALEVPRELRVLVVTKDRAPVSNSAWAQGGIAAVLAPEDAFANHVQDTHDAGGALCDPEVVELVDREDGRLALTREGGHSHPRIVHCLGDATGKEVMRALIEAVEKAPNISLW